MADWFENEELWRELFPFVFSEQRMQAANYEIEQILQLVAYNGLSVLDLCCGPGRHALILAQRGLQVTAVDRSPLLLDHAREQARKAEVDIEWVQEDMRDHLRPASYDLALNLFTSFGYFDDRADDQRVLANLHRSLRPGGTLLIEMASKEWIAGLEQYTTLERGTDGSVLIRHNDIVEDWSRVRNEWILIRDGKASTHVFHHNLYSGQDLKRSLRQAGFDNVRLFGDLDGHPFDRAARRLVAVATK
jgi:SAM-dependent methyltransferase